MVVITVLTANEHNNIKENFTRLVQVLKPHSQSINVMSVNPSYRYNKILHNTFIIFINYS